MKKEVNALWGGRFEKSPSDLLKKINNSISFDYRLAYQDIKVSEAYCEALFKAKIISSIDKKKILEGLNKIRDEIKNNTFEYSDEYEDIHMNIEMNLKKKIGDVAGKIHAGRSRNDQVTTDLKMWIREKTFLLDKLLLKLQKTLIKKAEANIAIIMPGFTHLQNAQPISLGHYFMSFFEMFERDRSRLRDMLERMDECPLGSGALAGTNFFEIDRNLLAKKLGFKKVTENSLDSVSDRDYAIEFLSTLSILSMHFSRISEDLIIWCTSQFSFIRFSDSFCTGSSIMPQKKNPDATELIRSKSSRIYGNLVSLLTTLKGLPMAYSKDLQEDKEPVFDSFDTMEIIIIVMTQMIDELIVNKDKMLIASKDGFSTATDLADWVVKNTDLPFRDAHHIAGRIVLMAEKKKCKLSELKLSELQKVESCIDKSIFNFLSVNHSVNQKNSYGGTSFTQVKKAIKRAKQKIKK
ncbi:argininosuccinate lyase [Rickettsiales bacterium]|nr:argininosuccinate lyase [Rickettsiales bacterium]